MKFSSVFIKLIIAFTIFYGCVVIDLFPFDKLMHWRQKLKATTEKQVNKASYLVYDMDSESQGASLRLELDAGKQFWYPQIAIWIENPEGDFIETLFITEATATGNFYSGRTKDNFKEYDSKSTSEDSPIARVDPLPYWSHKRNHQYQDGFYSPDHLNPMPDAISGATPSGNFIINSTLPYDSSTFSLMLEINVAFDENEYYSEYDFAEDSIYHSGTGQLGQPSLIYKAEIDGLKNNRYYLLNPIGHGHHSAQNGQLYPDLSRLTTAMDIIDRVTVRIN